MFGRATTLLAAVLAGALVPGAASTAQEPAGTVTGAVTAVDGGDPLAAVCVQAIALTGDGRAAVRTAADGSYRLEDVEPGVHAVTANACDEPRPGYVPALYAGDDDGAGLVVVEAGATVDGIDLALVTAGTITGRVTADDGGGALADVCVRAVTDASDLVAGTRTAADGTYRLTTAAPGENQVLFIECDAPRTRTPEAYDDQPLWPLTEDDLGGRVSVRAGATTSGIDASLALGTSVQGTVRLAHTHAPATFQFVGAWHAEDVDDLPTALAVTGLPALGLASDVFAPAPHGDFDLAGLPPGTWTFEAATAAVDPYGPGSWQQRWYGGADTRAAADRLTLQPGDVVEDVVLELAPRADIEPFCPQRETRFPDVPSSNVHSGAIECMADADIARGGDDGRYHPAAGVRRDQMAAFLTRLLLGIVPAERLPSSVPDAFRDDDGNPFEDDIDLLAAIGIVEGDASGRYRPAEVVGRGQMASFLARTYEFAADETIRTPATRFGDVEGTAHATSIRKVAVAAIAAGTSASSYEPGLPVRRDQMATFLARLSVRLSLDAGLFAGGSSDGSVGTASTARRAAGVGR